MRFGIGTKLTVFVLLTIGAVGFGIAMVSTLDAEWRLLTTALFLTLGAVLAHRVARRVTEPIAALARATETIGRRDPAGAISGIDLPVHRKDELGQLAQSVKRMAEALTRNGALLSAVSQASSHFLRVSDLSEGISAVLAAIGSAADVDRAYLFENHRDPATGKLLASQRFEWCGEGVAPQLGNPENQRVPYEMLGSIAEPLSRGQPFAKRVREMPQSEREYMERQQVRSLLLFPVVVEGKWWGLIGFDDCRRERDWSEAEMSALSTLAGTIGAAVFRCGAEKRWETASLHDELTGLPNRTLFTRRIAMRLEQARRSGDHGFAVMFLDLDRFKFVNDTLGHHVGDALLNAVAKRLLEVLPPGRGEEPGRGHVVARLGGDEFTVLLEHVPDREDAALVARQILHVLEESHELQGHDVLASASIGIAVAGPTYSTVSELLRDADVAMYKAKAAGRGMYAVFDPAWHEEAIKRLRLESDLRSATSRGELSLHYQPIVSLSTGEILGFESLLRWERAGKMVSPADFIPVAEDSGLIVEMGDWVLEEACRQLSQWRLQHPERELFVSINLSRKQLVNPSLIQRLERILQAYGLPAQSVKLEVTESAVMEDVAQGTILLAQLKQIGVGLYMDDFGTGYSSLSCLHRFPLDGLKIDRAFISNAGGRRDYAAVIHAIVTLARNLNMQVVAEGLETAEQVALLQALECECAQGYFFARPMTAEQAGEMLEKVVGSVAAVA